MKITGDLKNPKLIYLKGFLFLVTGTLSAASILIENSTVQTAFLLAIAIWSFCRLYYFMFYVIEKYVDDNYRFAGISSFILYLISRRKVAPQEKQTMPPEADRQDNRQ
jgi:hypothetical protein